MGQPQRINFIFNGREFAAQYTADGDVSAIYDYVAARFLNEDKETNERENPGVWVAAYAMLDA